MVSSNARFLKEYGHDWNHKCTDCASNCQWCGELYCDQDADTFTKVRIGDSMKFITVCQGCVVGPKKETA